MRLLSPSVDRVPSPCKVSACGGCPVQHLAPARQLALKQQALLDALRRIGGIEATEMLQPAPGPRPGWGSRHRVRLQARWQADSGWQLGYRARGSHALVAWQHCPILWPELEAQARALGAWLAPLPRTCALVEVELAYSRRSGGAAARLRLAQPLTARQQAALPWAQLPLAGVELVSGQARFSVGDLDLLYDHAAADRFALRFRPGQFTQASPAANDALVAVVLAAVQSACRSRPATGSLDVLELHAGIGNFTLPMAHAGLRVQAYESMPSAAAQNQENLAAAGMHARVHAEADLAALPLLAQAPVLLLDPPRTGAGSIAAALAAAPGPHLIYVACDPATLARDLGRLVAGGYRLTALHALDMFPQTPHIEAVACLAPPPPTR